MRKPHALRRWLKAEKITQSEGARRLGISDAYMSELIAGIKCPSVPLLNDFTRITRGKVGFKDFDWPARSNGRPAA